ncbi:PEST proteolytic signal-containing nuclear protein isoform X2 [Anoplophora glabripennis]|uniref:PEST proteolytic signal-containing nuclear protein isoform X2 n=1 Tax=Anoplophora glabripennis TaxID=217634 RepID=UPI00087441EC|nr:PEST proteolytic signal-containing nuclear protein isoform X2 [Anoplophora glabripennis]
MCLLGTRSIKKERSRSRSPRRREEIHIKKEIKEELDDKAQNSKEQDKKIENVGLGAKNRLKSMSIQMKLNSKKISSTKKPKLTVAAAFNQDSDSEPEEMPPEARMRMRNIGRDTPTSSGPNSFGKTKQGFSDAKKMFEKNLKEAMESALADD